MPLIPLTRGLFAVVDGCDFEVLSGFKWHAYKGKSNYYAVTVMHGKGVPMHRIILCPTMGKDIDHINNNGLDNRRSNLRICSRAQNSRNQRRRTNNTSGFKGVSWHSVTKRWRAAIWADGVFRYLGIFRSRIEAAIAYDDAAIELHREYAKLNFPFIYG